MKKRILLAVVTLLIIIQFFGIDKTSPPSNPSDDFLQIEDPPGEIALMFKSSCYDCHSNHTRFPWYINIQPVGWWINGHIKGGRQNLNFSEWGSYDDEKKSHKLEEAIEEVREKHMPLKSYTWLHPDAKLTEDDRQSLINWMNR